MKITLDIDSLLAENQINQTEYDKLKMLAAESTGSLAFNILIGFGVIAVSGAALALVPSFYTAMIIGAIVLCSGLALLKFSDVQWKLLSQICILIGALMFGMGIVGADEGKQRSFFLLSMVYAISAVFAQSSLLVVLAVLAIGPVFGASTGYADAMYMIGIYEPFLTVVVFTLLGLVLFYLSTYLKPAFAHLAIIASRTCVFMVNMGFWIGSLWGDSYKNIAVAHSDIAFSIVWAIALIAAGVWAWHINRRWLLNVVAIFAGIHFYTQWFEHLGATPGTVLLAGVLALGFALVLKHVNTKMA